MLPLKSGAIRCELYLTGPSEVGGRGPPALGSPQMAPQISIWPFSLVLMLCSLSPLKRVFKKIMVLPTSNWGRGEGYKLFVTQLPSSSPWQLVECIIRAKISCPSHPRSSIRDDHLDKKSQLKEQQFQ